MTPLNYTFRQLGCDLGEHRISRLSIRVTPLTLACKNVAKHGFALRCSSAVHLLIRAIREAGLSRIGSGRSVVTPLIWTLHHLDRHAKHHGVRAEMEISPLQGLGSVLTGIFRS